MHTRGIDFVDNRNTADARRILNDIGDSIARTGTVLRLQKRVEVVIGPEPVQLLASQGMSKRDVKEYLVANSFRRVDDLRRAGKDGEMKIPKGTDSSTGSMHGMAEPTGRTEGDPGGDERFRVLQRPDDVLVVVAGAPNAGVSAVAQPLGFPPRFPGRSLVRPKR